MANNINKKDFYFGSFLSYLISNKVKEPIIFETVGNSRVIQFGIKDKKYNAYLKYVGTAKPSTVNGEKYTQWVSSFTDKEIVKLFSDFEEEGFESIVVIVCTNEKLSDTYFAILSWEQAKRCLGEDSVNKQRRITIRRKKGSNHLTLYGTGLSLEKAIECSRNVDKYFGLN